MVIKILISADSKRRKSFIDCIKKICDDSKGRYECHFLPDEVADLRAEERLKEMFEHLRDSDLIFMDVTSIGYTVETTEGVENYWMTNQGVLIEYGAIMALEYLMNSIELFCESAVKLERLHPYFLKKVNHYSEEKVNDIDDPKSLRNMVMEVIKNFENRIHKEYRILKRDEVAYKYVLKRSLE